MSQQFSDHLDKRTQLEAELKVLEQQIYDLETHYLEETMNSGWEGYFANKQTKNQPFPIKKPKIAPNDRVFSLSSTTSPAQQNVEENFERNKENMLGLPTYYRSKRNKKKQKYDKLARPGLSDSPRNFEQESSLINDDFQEEESSQVDPNDSLEDIRLKSPMKKKKIKKNQVKSKNTNKHTKQY